MSGPGVPMNVSERSNADRAQLKAATRRLVKLAGGAECAQHVTRVKAAALSRFGSVSDEQFMPIDVVADLEADIGSAVVTAALAAQMGCRLVQCETMAGDGAPLAAENIATMLQREADIASQIVAALADGKVTGSEAQAIAGACERAIAELRDVQRAAQASALKGQAHDG